MPDDSPRLLVPNPDPSDATNAALARINVERDTLVRAQLKAVKAAQRGHRDVIETRLGAIDKASEVLAETINRVPTDLQVAIATVKELNAVKFLGIAEKFELLDKQTARESAANTLAVNAAFAAQKESAAATDKANAEAIRKSEAATAETINKLEQLVAGQITSLNEKVDSGKTSVTETRQELIAADASFRSEMTGALNALREQVVGLTAKTAGNRESRTDFGQVVSYVIAGLALAVSIIVAVALILKP